MADVSILTPYAHIDPEVDGVELLKQVEARARVSHRSEGHITEGSAIPFVRSVVLNHGDWSVVEHVSVTVQALVDRGVSHEWVRHRLGAYTQESTRFVNYGKQEPGFILPPGGFKSLVGEAAWYAGVENSLASYHCMLAVGESPQVARDVLPNCLATRLDVTYNLRMWRHFLLMRTTRETHPKMRQVTVPLLLSFKQVIPVLYEDIEPLQTQRHNLGLAR